MFITLKIKKAVVAVLLAVICAAVFTLSAIKPSAEQSEKQGIFVPIIMYHSILKDEAMRGEFVVSPAQVERDIQYLKENGYTAVFVNDLIRYVNYGGELPEKPVILTFDDGTYNNFTYLLPLLEEYDYKASISVVGSYTVKESESGEEPNPAYSYLRFEDINAMRDSGYVEFCNHTYDMHNLGQRTGIRRMEGESYEEYRSIFIKDVFKVQELLDENCGFKPNVFTYPYGASGESARRLVKNSGFEASMGVEEKPNYIIRDDPDCMFDLNRYNRSGLVTTEEFMQRALKE